MQLLVLVAAVVSAVTTPAPTEAALPTRDVPVAEATVRPETTIRRQCDPELAALRILTRTLCSVGCLVLSIQRSADENGRRYTTAEFLELLRRHNVFNSRGEIVWDNLAEALPVIPTRFRESVSASAVREHLESGRSVLLRVPGSRNFHWVFAAEVVGDDILVDDSRDGTRVSLRERYNNNVSGHVTLDWLPMTS